MDKFTIKDKEAVERIYAHAEHKTLFAQLLLHSYNPQDYNCNINGIMRYIASEPSDSSLQADVMVVLDLMKKGVEAHEVIGRPKIDALIEQI